MLYNVCLILFFSKYKKKIIHSSVQCIFSAIGFAVVELYVSHICDLECQLDVYVA
jgi:hypothetical protein